MTKPTPKAKPGNPTWTKGGPSPNPGGRPKAVRELHELARAEVPASFDFAKKLRDDENQDARVRLDAAKFLTAYGLGAPPKMVDDASADRGDGVSLAQLRALAAESPDQVFGKQAHALLTQQEREALARRSLSTEGEMEGPDDD